MNAPGSPKVLRWLDALTMLANISGSLIILSLVLLIGADVFGRNLLGAPISGVPEMVTLSIVAIVFLQAPMALKAGRMTRSAALLNALQRRAPRVGSALESLFDLAGMVVLVAILYSHWPILARAWQRDDFIGAIGDFTAPTWPVKLMLLIGATLLLLQFGARIWRRHLGSAP